MGCGQSNSPQDGPKTHQRVSRDARTMLRHRTKHTCVVLIAQKKHTIAFCAMPQSQQNTPARFARCHKPQKTHHRVLRDAITWLRHRTRHTSIFFALGEEGLRLKPPQAGLRGYLQHILSKSKNSPTSRKGILECSLLAPVPSLS